MNVQILSDSASDLSPDMYDEYNIEVVPASVIIEGKEYLDGITITPKEMYDAMRAGKKISTSQANPQAFKSAFLKSAETNQPLIYFTLSAALSGMYQSAKIMEQEVKDKYPQAPIYIIDTKCASLGYGLVIIRAAELAASGVSVKEIIDIATYHAEHMEHVFTLDNLEYAYRSGRLSRTASYLGTFLKIKPILHIKRGELAYLGSKRGSKRVINRLIDIAEERGVNLKKQVIGICHGDNLKEAKRIATLCKEKLGAKNTIIKMIGSGIGSHAGPGVLGLFFLNKSYK